MSSPAGACLFRHRAWLPIPLVAATLLFPPRFPVAGILVMLTGEALRLWAAGAIGLPSRTRDESVGPLVTGGPYRLVRNPLYLANLVIFAGLGIAFWPAAVVLVPLLAAYYATIVRWEEANLSTRLGEPYRDYAARVRRWIPRVARPEGAWSPRIALRSERGTAVVLTLVLVLIALRCYTTG